jgi:predicted glycosyltransferase
MRFLIDIHHPKHVHFFRPFIRRWRERGDEVRIVTRDKDITHALLDLYGLDYVCLSRQQKGWRSGIELLRRWLGMASRLRSLRPDVVLSVAGISTAPPARILGIPNIAFTDTETAELSNRIAFPFADRIVTPEWYVGRHGPRHHVYRGFHEWSYLNPAEFRPDPAVVAAEGIDPGQPYAVVRLVQWIAAHDRGESGFTADDVVRLVERLARERRVYLSVEGPVPPALRGYVARLRVDRIHHVLAGASLVVGESPSMATESALLGVPAVLVSSWAQRCGNMQVLEQRYGLMRVCSASGAGVEAALELAERPPDRDAAGRRRQELFADLCDMQAMMDEQVAAVVERTRG